MSSQVPFTEEVCKIVLVNTCNPVTVTECNDVTKNVRLALSTSIQHHHDQQKHMLNSSAAFPVHIISISIFLRFATMRQKMLSEMSAC